MNPSLWSHTKRLGFNVTTTLDSTGGLRFKWRCGCSAIGPDSRSVVFTPCNAHKDADNVRERRAQLRVI